MANFGRYFEPEFMPDFDTGFTPINLAGPLQEGVSQAIATPGPRKKRSFFSKDGAFWDVLGALGDGLSGDHHYANMAQQNRQAQLDDERYERRRQEALDDFWTRRPWQ